MAPSGSATGASLSAQGTLHNWRGCLQLAVGLAVGRYFYGHFIKYSLALKVEVLNGLMDCHYRLWQGQHRQLWLAVVVSCLSS